MSDRKLLCLSFWNSGVQGGITKITLVIENLENTPLSVDPHSINSAILLRDHNI